MNTKGFTLIEMLMYVALFSVFTVYTSLLYVQIQQFFVNRQMYLERYIVSQYVKRVTEHAVDFKDKSCVQGGAHIYCDQVQILDSAVFQRINFLGEISNVHFDVQDARVLIKYVLRTGKKVFLEQIHIYLI